MKTDFKGGRIIHLLEDFSRVCNIQAVAWVLLAAFSQIYSGNQEQNAKNKTHTHTKFQFGPGKVGDKSGMVAKEISAISKKPNILC